ncbi:MAG: hypothetical protein ACXQTS_06810, partial [Candidatus Methanospirareceae archaeon]
ILLDEPFAGLDVKTCDVLVDYFKMQKNKTVIISSHSIEWTKKICNRGVLLERGKIKEEISFQE